MYSYILKWLLLSSLYRQNFLAIFSYILTLILVFTISILVGRGSMRISTSVKEMISVLFAWESLAWTIHFKPFSWLCHFQTEGFFSCISAPTKWRTERKPWHRHEILTSKSGFDFQPYCFLRELEGWVLKAEVGRNFEILLLELQILVWQSNIKLDLLFWEFYSQFLYYFSYQNMKDNKLTWNAFGTDDK